MNAYAKVVSGFKSGGTSQRSANAELFSRGFDEEDILSYEVGFKGDFWDHRARLNAAVFHMDLDGLQASAQTGPTPGDRDFLPIDGNTVDGLELDLTLQLTDGLTAKFDYGYLNTDLGEDHLTTAVGTFDLIGEMWYAPENSFTASVDYYLPVSNGAVDFNVNYAYRDSVNTSINIADNAVIDDYDVVGASINWSDITLGTLPGTFRVLLWGRNLLDEEYNTFAIRSWQIFGASQTETFGDPRTYGVTLSYTY
jgi:iron complex outermembrane receptor protein